MNDTFGAALVAFLEGGTTSHEIERDDGKIDVVDTGVYFAPYDKWPKLEREIIGFSEGKVLEIGCGGGRISKHLESLGHEVIGIDLSALALQAAMRHGASDCRLIDAREMDFPDDYFDSVSLMGNGLGLGGDYDTCRGMLVNLSKIVRTGGLLLATSRDPVKTDDPVHLAYHQRNREKGNPIGLVRLRVNFDGVKGDWFDFQFIELNKLSSLLSGTGWEVERLMESSDPMESVYGLVLRNTK